MRIIVAHGAAALVFSIEQDLHVAKENKSSSRVMGVMAFAPWVLFGVSSGFNHWRVAAGSGLTLSILYLSLMRLRGGSIKLMDWTMLAFFVIASVLAIVLQSPIFPTYNAVIVWSCFAVAAWGSVLVGHPFTAAYARENAPREFWDDPVFIRLNLVMTLIW
jgi:intracellular septation protein A